MILWGGKDVENRHPSAVARSYNYRGPLLLSASKADDLIKSIRRLPDDRAVPSNSDPERWTGPVPFTAGHLRRAAVGFTLTEMRAAGAVTIGPRRPPSRVGALPKTTDYVVARPVEVDMREPLRAYVLGATRVARKSQWVVRGHWRNQACGEALAQRRRIWIKPFWKGPAHAPIRIREHVIVERVGDV